MAFWIFQNVVITAALAAAVALVCRAGRIGPVVRHALWVLVLVKFVTPPLVVWPWAAPDPFSIATIDTRTSAAHVVAPRDVEPMTPSRNAANPPDPMDPTDPMDPVDPRLWPWVLGIWAAGSLVVLGIEGVRVARLTRRIRIGAAASADSAIAIASRVAALALRLRIRPVPVVMMAGSGSPVVWGLGRPVLLWPTELPADSSDACIDGLIVHELAHVKRGDHLVGWIELAAGIVWWWNPLFWFVRSALREQAELACDAWVISALPNGRRAYAESLLALSGADVRGASSLSTSMAAVGIRATSRRVLERRLVMIMKGRAPLRLSFVGLVCLAFVAAATLPAWATSQQYPPPPPPPPAPVVRQVPPQNPPPPPAPVPVRKVALPLLNRTLHVTRPTNLTEEAQHLVESFDKDRAAIELEADQKVQARTEAAVKALQDLQEQYTKAGKLDEAVAIRDYLRAGGPGTNLRYALRTIKR